MTMVGLHSISLLLSTLLFTNAFHSCQGLGNVTNRKGGQNMTVEAFNKLVRTKGCTKIHDKICLDQGYESGIPPYLAQGTVIQVTFHLEDFPEIDDNKLTMSVLLTLELTWSDARLVIHPEAVDDMRIGAKVLEQLWIPDISITRLKHVKQMSVFHPIQGAEVSKDGTIKFFSNLEATVYCAMNFKSFPLDEQECHFFLTSAAYGHDILRFVSLIRNDTLAKRLQSYKLVITELAETSQSGLRLAQDKFSFCGFTVLMKRRWMGYVMSYHLPCMAMVTVSWMSFLVNPDVVPGRCALLVTVFLVLTTIFSAIQRDTPRSHGLTALGLYALVCLTFVFLSMVEYAALLFLRRTSTHLKAKAAKGQNQVGVASGLIPYRGPKKRMDPDWNSKAATWMEEVDTIAYWTDLSALSLFSLSFVVFNIVYFA